MLAWLAGAEIAIGEDELRGACRRAVLLLAAGGDPHRALELGGRTVTALAADLDRPGRRAELGRSLARLRAEGESLALVGRALDGLLADEELAWRAYAAGLLAEELTGD